MVHLTRKLVVGASNVTPGGVRTGGLSSLPPIDDFRVLPMDNAHGFGSAIKDFNASLYKTHTHALTTHSMSSTITTKKREGDDLLSTWGKSRAYQRDFSTVASESYIDPVLRDNIVDHQLQHTFELNKEVIRAQNESKIAEKVEKIALANYGNVSNMLRAFNKKSRDKITFDEFTNNIKHNKLDENFNEHDQKELFKLVEKHQDASGAIPIKDIIGCVDQRVAISDTHYKKDMFAIRDFLAVQLKKHRDKKLIEQEDIMNTFGTSPIKATHNVDEDKALKKAIGQKTFDLDIGAEELNQIIDESFTNSDSARNNNKFARFLRMTNLNLQSVPFYDVRTDRLRLLKERSAALKQAADNEINVLAAKKDRYDTAVMNTSSTVSNNDSYLTRSMTNPDLLTKKTARNLAGSASVGVLDTSHDDASVSQVGLQLGNTSFYNDDNISAFSPETSSVKFNSSIQGETPKYFGKRLFAQDQTDWNRIGHGGSTQQNAGIEPKEHYRSVYRDRYDDMIYEPSKAPARPTCVSQSSIEWNNTVKKREQRYARTKANLEITAARLELEEITKKTLKIRREQRQNDAAIAYQTNAFLNDVKSFKKQPLEIVSKKPHLSKSDQMWGGSMKSILRQKMDASSSDTYTSTYRNSYDASTLYDSRNIEFPNELAAKIFAGTSHVI